MNFGLLVWGIIGFIVMVRLQDQTRQQLFALSYQMTAHPGCALSLFGFFMFPGTLVHESSHYVTALLVGSKVSQVSLQIKYDQDGIEMGSVTAKDVGSFRNSLISIAPAVIGSLLILLIGWAVFDFPGVTTTIEAGQWDNVLPSLASPLNTLWGWVGAYAILIISINMLPSPQDVQSGARMMGLFIVLSGLLWIVFITKGDDASGAIQVTNTTLIWLGLALAFVIAASLPVFLLLKLLTSGSGSQSLAQTQDSE
jgi:hypothetical protein